MMPAPVGQTYGDCGMGMAGRWRVVAAAAAAVLTRRRGR